MAENKKSITPENIYEWMASTGFLMPRNEIELERFEKLFKDVDLGLTGKEIDPNKIISGEYKIDKKALVPKDISSDQIKEYRIAARNGEKLPANIMDKILKNQRKKKDDRASEEETDN